MSKRSPAVEVQPGAIIPRKGKIDDDGLLFDRTPITVGVDAQERGGFRFRGRSVDVVGAPTAKGFQEALALACEFHESSPYWIGGLVAYAEDRDDWREKVSQIMSVTKLARKTLLNLGYVYRHVSEEAKVLAPTPTHARRVANLPPTEQVEWMDRARSHEWTDRDLELHIRDAKRRKVLEGRAVMEGLYRVLMVDAPWIYNDRPPSGSGAQQHYSGMTVDQLMALPVAAHATPDAAMGFWVPAPLMGYATEPEKGPDWYRILRAWGFTAKAQMIWDKSAHNVGHYVSVQHEVFVICTRGSCTPDRLTPMIDSVYTERPTEHSAKPEFFRQTLERLWDGPYLELFGRERHDGWMVWGNDARLIDQGVPA